jgi:hypothetical protein
MQRLLHIATTVALVAAAFIATDTAARRSRAVAPSRSSAISSSAKPAVARAPRGTAARVRAVAPVVASPAPGSASLVLTVDPETGMLGLPESQQHRALTIPEMQALARAESEGLVTIHNPDGSETLNHQGRFADRVVVRMGPDGKKVMECIQGEGQLERALHGTPAPAPTAEEK